MSNKIDLTLPIDPAYVSAARLTASSVANRMGFDIDEIEDIKAAVSEASTYIIKHSSSSESANLHITFEIRENEMEITIIVENSSKITINPDDMSLIMIKALTEEFTHTYKDDTLIIKMLKKHNSLTFEP